MLHFFPLGTITNDFFFFFLFLFLSEWSVISKSWDKLSIPHWHHRNYITFLAGAQCNSTSLSSKVSAFPYHHIHSLEAGQIHVLWPRGSSRVREQKSSVLSVVLCSQAAAARSVAVSLREAHNHKATCRGRDSAGEAGGLGDRCSSHHFPILKKTQ